jgi:hypothetical protein
VIAAGNPAKVVKELDPDRKITTRMDYYADPVGLENFFDEVDKQVLADNSFWRWLFAVLYPASRP